MSEGEPVVAYTPSAGSGEPGTAELISRLTDQISRLIRDELRFAQKEMTRQGKRAGVGGAALGGAGLLAAFGLGALAAAGGLGLTRLIPDWAAALVVAGGLLGIAGFSALIGIMVLRRIRPMPDETLENVRTDVQTVKAGLKK